MKDNRSPITHRQSPITNHLSRRSLSESCGNETHLLELSKQPKQHFFGIDPFVKAESSRFGGIRHDIIFEVENRFSKWPGGGVVERVFSKRMLLNGDSPDR